MFPKLAKMRETKSSDVTALFWEEYCLGALNQSMQLTQREIHRQYRDLSTMFRPEPYANVLSAFASSPFV